MLSGYIMDVSLRPVRNKTIRFVPRPYIPTTEVGLHFIGDPSIVRRNILSDEVKAVTDSNGYVELVLPRQGVYEMHLYGSEHPNEITATINVPNRAGSKIEDVLFPYVVSVEYETDPIQIHVGEAVEVPVVITMSDDSVLADAATIIGLLSFDTDDNTIALANLLKDSILSVIGCKIGTTTVTVARKDNTYAKRLPDVSPILVTPATVEVS
jgi:hypothetical protein